MPPSFLPSVIPALPLSVILDISNRGSILLFPTLRLCSRAISWRFVPASGGREHLTITPTVGKAGTLLDSGTRFEKPTFL